jgi:hypothetical protein
MEAVPISLNFLLNEMSECKEDSNYNGRFEFDYVAIMSKFVKKLKHDSPKKIKKSRRDNNGEYRESNEENLYYKYETEYFLKKSIFSIEYKIPHENVNMDSVENSNEPQYFNIQLIKFSDFCEVVNFLNESK